MAPGSHPLNGRSDCDSVLTKVVLMVAEVCSLGHELPNFSWTGLWAGAWPAQQCAQHMTTANIK